MWRSLYRRAPVPNDVTGLRGVADRAAHGWQRRTAAVTGLLTTQSSSRSHLGARLLSSSASSLRANPRRCIGAPGSAPHPCSAARHLSYVTNAANFEAEVLQSQQAICLIYYIPNRNCSAYLKAAEKLVDSINAQATGLDAAASTSGSGGGAAEVSLSELTVEVNGTQVSETAEGDAAPSTLSPASSAAPTQRPNKMEWLKLCTINADENRNLASAFSVERARLPITYFVMQGTIVDKVVGHVAEARLSSILIKFLEHYQKEMNVDLLARQNKSSRTGGASASPLPSAATADLLSGASTAFLQEKIMNALVGADMIQLPEEAEKLDGLRRTLQEAKKKAHAELQELHKQLGMDVRRLSDAEMQAYYFKAPQFYALGRLCALEALYLARSHATLGDVARVNVDWARHAVRKDFEAIQGDLVLRRVLALVDANLVRGELRTAAVLAAQDANRLCSFLAAMDTDDVRGAQHRNTLKEMEALIAGQSQYCLDMLRIIDDNIDSRTLDGSAFPSAIVDQLFELLKSNLKLSRTHLSQSSRTAEADAPDAGGAEESMKVFMDGKAIDTTAKRVLMAKARVPQVRTLIMSLLQLYPTDPKSQDARSRLASLLY
ncbi:conserved hypothetical protein [Leishmania infantum JPCM5]|uniref:Uncharacterized protein n=2 Tax=Leishmania infantum TaxID=5671 RepID=A4I265_LEIIN|nr:conserved hypothetical protein [Leishmania infantum JPCM5]CAC9496769.1 hypothetical_protein_-_conserved [Leishmania infantum]CAM68852.1 conserved hypothetical protein [Leishmania infantum JPCM5]SUZ42726.1 hypothetical_protein_-_conserved [Leishmania infantum]|eukprot:XP_001470476.1 conserved hypothetical protein [Leishmania infantum JPCM5]